MKPRKFKELLDRYAKGECTAEEHKLIDEWYEAIGQGDVEKLEKEIHEELSARSLIEADLWSKINPRPIKIKTDNSRYFLRAAAAILLLAMVGPGLYFLLNNKRFSEKMLSLQQTTQVEELKFARHFNSGDKPQEITLADGSYVMLKPRSEIRFPKKFNSEKREIRLTGEAFFNVKRDPSRPFLVYANEVVTKVLGTSFNIKAYENEKEVTVAVKTGKVSVYASKDNAMSVADAASIILTPNQQVVYNRESEQVSKELVKKPEIILPVPTLFKMSYDGAPVTKIFEVLEENYGVKIEYDSSALSACVLTTSMSDEGLYERIQIICKAINAEYTVTDAVISIKSSGCF
jgi:ferric-dicitrate binding protein FerR (iron transport regulator)